jgi:hypothetical protein
MNFCKECDNYLTLQMKETTTQDKLIYVCKNCGFDEEYNSLLNKNEKDEFCIYKNYYDKNDILTHNENIKFLSEDPTLPRVNNINCPNDECITNTNLDSGALLNKDTTKSKKQTDNKNEVVYLIINDQDMIFQYLCCNCKTSWTNR